MRVFWAAVALVLGVYAPADAEVKTYYAKTTNRGEMLLVGVTVTRGNGDVTPCDFTPYAFGNVREKSIKDIWQDITQHDIYAEGSHRCRLASSEYWDQLEASATSV